MKRIVLSLIASFCLFQILSAQVQEGELITKQLQSEILKDNLVDLETRRNLHIYLPPNYDESNKNYPVVYYLHNIYSNPLSELNNFEITHWINTAISQKEIDPFILVAPDFSTSTSGSWYENSTTSGRWLDYFLEEVRPFVESNYRTINKRESRALIGHYVGGRGALKLAMEHSNLFSVVYAMNPVATGTGYKPATAINVNWDKIHNASTFEEVNGLGRTTVFVTLCQAFLPNPNRPPFYCDFIMEKVDGAIKLDAQNNATFRKRFLLDEILESSIEKIEDLNGLAYDWARFDPTQAHVISNRRLSKLLTEYGIEYEGEEYAGNPWEKYAGEHGRFNTRVIPFLSRKLTSE